MEPVLAEVGVFISLTISSSRTVVVNIGGREGGRQLCSTIVHTTLSFSFYVDPLQNHCLINPDPTTYTYLHVCNVQYYS